MGFGWFTSGWLAEVTTDCETPVVRIAISPYFSVVLSTTSDAYSIWFSSRRLGLVFTPTIGVCSSTLVCYWVSDQVSLISLPRYELVIEVVEDVPDIPPHVLFTTVDIMFITFQAGVFSSSGVTKILAETNWAFRVTTNFVRVVYCYVQDRNGKGRFVFKNVVCVECLLKTTNSISISFYHLTVFYFCFFRGLKNYLFFSLSIFDS